jgi:hypothetical protein
MKDYGKVSKKKKVIKEKLKSIFTLPTQEFWERRVHAIAFVWTEPWECLTAR